jgi:hypothetical protein
MQPVVSSVGRLALESFEFGPNFLHLGSERGLRVGSKREVVTVGSDCALPITEERGIASLVPNLRNVNGARLQSLHPSANCCQRTSRFASFVPEPRSD